MPSTLPAALVKALADAGFVAVPTADIAPVKAAPARKAKSLSPSEIVALTKDEAKAQGIAFTDVLAAKATLKVASGDYIACPNDGRPFRASRTPKRDGVVVCKECLHASPKEFSARHARYVKRLAAEAK